MGSGFPVSPTGNTSLGRSATLANGIKDALFVSRYNISRLVSPFSQILIERKILALSLWQAQRFHRSIADSVPQPGRTPKRSQRYVNFGQAPGVRQSPSLPSYLL